MNKEEYFQQVKLIEHEAKIKKGVLSKNYAMASKVASIGDVVTDHHQTIMVEALGWGHSFRGDVPQARYTGVKLKKDLTPYKSGELCTVYEGNIESVNGKKINA